MKTKCPHCDQAFPDELMSPMFVNGKMTPPIDPICALAIKNEIHGTSFTEFQGEIAQHLLEETQEYLAKL